MRNDSVDAAHLPRAGDFEPERWLRGGEGAVGKHLSMPFGAGVRTCPGRYLALLEIKLASAMLLSSFELLSIDTVDGAEPEELMGFTMSPVGLRMRLGRIDTV